MGSSWLPDLYIGVTDAIFHVAGKVFVVMDRFMIEVITGIRVGPASLINLAVRPSRPQALDGDSFATCSVTSDTLVSVRLKIGGHFDGISILVFCGRCLEELAMAMSAA